VINNAFVFVHQSLHKLNDTLRKKGSTNKTIVITPSHFLDAIQHFVKKKEFFKKFFLLCEYLDKNNCRKTNRD